MLVTATNTAGTNQAASSPTNTIPAVSQPPLNNQPPTVTGTATVGNQLTATAGSWSGSPTPTFTYQWQDCDTNGANCSPISGATNTTYTITNQDIGFTIEVLVTATNTAGTNQAASSPTNTIPAVSQPPLNNQPPTVTGTATVGNQLTATAGSWSGSPTPTFTYQWQDCDTNGANCSPISGATNTTYTITNQDIGFTIEVLVTATNTAGTNQAASSPTNTIPAVSQPPLNNQPPTVTGTATVGNQLTATAGSWTGSPTPTFTYQWQDCDTNGANCSPISGATNTTYTITNQDIGFTIEVLVTATNTAGTNQAASNPTNTIPAPAPTTPVLDNFNRANGAAGGNWSLLKSSGFAKMNVSGNTAVDSLDQPVRLELLGPGNLWARRRSLRDDRELDGRRHGADRRPRHSRKHILRVFRLRLRYGGVVDHPHRQRRNPGHPCLRRHPTARRRRQVRDQDRWLDHTSAPLHAHRRLGPGSHLQHSIRHDPLYGGRPDRARIPSRRLRRFRRRQHLDERMDRPPHHDGVFHTFHRFHRVSTASGYCDILRRQREKNLHA